MSHIIFRRSENTNLFGLRGYWTYDTETFELHSFATSRDLAKWSTVTNLQAAGFEMLRKETVVPPQQQANFLAVCKTQKEQDDN
jgi:hypothetical protein